MENKKCDNCNFQTGTSYQAVGSAVEAIWCFCSQQCRDQYFLEGKDKPLANSGGQENDT